MQVAANVVHDDDPIYLDHNATTPILPDVFEAMVPWLRDGFGNPSSGHIYGKRAKGAVEQARAQVAQLLGCSSDEIVFTSGGTEANNLAIRGVLKTHPEKKHLITSVIEHPATAKPCAYLARLGYRQDIVGVDGVGRVNADEIEDKLAANTGLVTIMHANNETGVLQPITAISRVTHANGTFLHTDAAQSLGKVPVDVQALGVDLLSIAGHKLYAPKGVGALFIKKGVLMSPFLLGAGHERGLRPGTENVASIVGLGKACEIAKDSLAEEAQRMQVLRDDLWSRLQKHVPGIALNGHPKERLPNTLSVRFPRISGTELLAHTPGVAASTGSACHDGHESASSVITAMGVRPDEALGTVRLTLGRGTTETHVVHAAELLAEAWKRHAH
jgi:cysteine desulfurase